MRLSYAAMFAASVCAAMAQAQTAPGPATLTLERAIALAERHAPTHDITAAGIDAAAAARDVAGLRPNPSLQSQVENIAGSGLYRGTASAETSVALAVPIELGGKRGARIALANAQGLRARIDAATLVADLRLRVTRAYATASAAAWRQDIAADLLRIADANGRAAAVRVRVGRASPIEVQRAEVLRINAATAAGNARRSAEAGRAALARLIGVPAGTIAADLDRRWFDRIEPATPLGASADAAALTVAAADADRDAAAAQARLARSQRLPDISLSAGARRLSATGDTAAIFGLSVPIPLFDGGRSAVAQAEAGRRRAEAIGRAARIDAEQAIADARAELANAAAEAEAASGPALAAAREGARIARIGYAEGKFGQLDLIDAERSLAQTRLAAVDALAAYHDARARLDRLAAPADPKE
jgi:cobalt-zinc-cadmium efflux system outer membrane protein